MKWPYRFFLFILVALFFWGSERFVHQITEGFTLLNIWDSYSFDPKWEPSHHQDWEIIRPVTLQKYRFLRSGGQNYAFISEDGDYVLKVTKYKRMRIPVWIEPIPLFSPLLELKERKIAKKKKILDLTFDSYLIAFNSLSDFSGIVYLHLNKTSHLKQTLILVDLLGIEHSIDLDNYAFILQKRGKLTFKYFDDLMFEGEVEKSKEMLRKMVRYVAHRISLCIEDHDIGFGTNFGVLDDKPFQLDLGSLRFNPSFASEAKFTHKLNESLEDLVVWLKCTHPSLIPTLEDEVASLSAERIYVPISFYR
jgi:hypothetical protein